MLSLLANSTIDIRSGIEEFSQQPVETSLTPIIADVINGVVIIGALLFLLYLLLGAIGWITAGGDKGKVEQARERMIQAFIGLTVIVFVYAIYTFALNFLNIDLGQDGGSSAGSGLSSPGRYSGEKEGGTGVDGKGSSTINNQGNPSNYDPNKNEGLTPTGGGR